MTMRNEDRDDMRRPSEKHESRRYEEDDMPAQGDSRRPLLMTLAIVAIGCLLIFMWANSSMVSKKDFQTNIGNVVKDMGSLQTGISGLQTSVKSLQTSIGGISTLNNQLSQANDKISGVAQDVAGVKTSLNNYVKSDSITQMSSSVSSMQSSVTSMESSVNTMKTQVADFKKTLDANTSTIETLKMQLSAAEAKITILEQGGSTSSSSSKKINVTVKTLGNNAMSPIDRRNADGAEASDGTYDGLQASMRLTLTNTTAIDIDDAIVDLEFSVYPLLPSYTPTLSGGGVPWHREYSDSQFMEFYNGAWGLEVPAGQSVNINLTLTLQGSNSSAWNASGGYYYQLSASAS